jgi:hypothetical protein
LPSSFRQDAFVFPGDQHVAQAAFDEGGGRPARPGIEHRHVPEDGRDQSFAFWSLPPAA